METIFAYLCALDHIYSNAVLRLINGKLLSLLSLLLLLLLLLYCLVSYHLIAEKSDAPDLEVLPPTFTTSEGNVLLSCC